MQKRKKTIKIQSEMYNLIVLTILNGLFREIFILKFVIINKVYSTI